MLCRNDTVPQPFLGFMHRFLVLQSAHYGLVSAAPDSALHSVAVYCSGLQSAAVCCSVLQCDTVCCSALQCVAVWCSHDTVHGWATSLPSTYPPLSVLLSAMQCAAVCCSVLQCLTVYCSHDTVHEWAISLASACPPLHALHRNHCAVAGRTCAARSNAAPV